MVLARRLLALLALMFAVAGALAATPASAPPPALYAAIDLGSRGIKAFLYAFVAEADGLDARVLYQSDIRTTLVSGADGRRFTEAGIRDASRAAAELAKALDAEARKRGQPVTTYIIGSSGVAAFDNREALKQAVEQATGLTMSFIDAAQEARYATLAAVPLQRRPQGVAVDIGSGNTKIGCIAGARAESREIGHGTVKLRKAAAEGGTTEADFLAALERIVAAEVRPAVQGCVLERSHLYWVGGAAWATATFTHPEAALQSYVPLTTADLDDFLARLKAGSWNQGEPRLKFPATVPAAQRESIGQKALADRRAVMDVFSREDLIAGVSLMRAVVQARAEAPARMYFRRDANYLFGWALERFRPEPLDEGGPRYLAGIDLGSRGAKAFIYAFAREGEGLDARVEFSENVNHKLASTAVDNRFTPAGIDEATQAVVRLLAQMRQFSARQNIEPRYYLVASSGVGAFANRDELKAAVEAASGLPLDFVDARTEARHALRAAVPEKRLQEGVVVDIGSQNTKLACLTGTVANTDELPYGTQRLRSTVPAEQDFDTGLEAVVAKVAAGYRTLRMNTPCYGNRNRIYFVGGAPWAVTTFMQPESVRLGWVPFSRQDTETFIDRLRKGTWNQVEPTYSFGPTVGADARAAIRQESTAARAGVQNVFSREDLLAGASLVRMVQAQANPSAQFFFVRNGNYLFGYALEKFDDLR